MRWLLATAAALSSSAHAQQPSRASNIAADLVRRSPLARAFAAEAPRRAAALQNYVRQLASCGQSETSLFVVYHGVTHLNGSVFEDQRARGVRVAGDVLRDACDFDLGAFTETLAPDSFYQTLMSEHAALILLGLAAKPIATATGGARLGTCSWKARLKGRPVPCDSLQNLPASTPRSLTYWGPGGLGPPATPLAETQRWVARKQVNGEDLMQRTLRRFFREVFGYDADPALLADAPPGNPPLPWSNYFVASPDLWEEIARFDLVASVWLDATYPPTTKGEEGCPATYDALRRKGVLARARVEPECRYCRAPHWTNWNRCRVGCHRCWSYVLEQLNVIYFRALTDLAYVHDDAACASPKRWAGPLSALGDFSPSFVREVYEGLVGGGA
jgi:hypothetical protein